MKVMILSLSFILAAAASARAQAPGQPQPELSDEQKWGLTVEKTVPEAELEAAASDAEAASNADPLMALAAKYGLDTPPSWLRDRVQTQAASVTLAALGDSITAGTASCAFPYIYCPGNSWSTGNLDGSLRRQLEAGSGREVRGLLVAVPGVTMKSVPAEAFVVFLASRFGLDVERMTLLIGHNDPGVCGAPAGGQDALFSKNYATALRILAHVARSRSSKLFVSGLVDVPVLARYAALTPNGAGKTCREIWAATGRCSRFLGHLDDASIGAGMEAQVAAYDGLLESGAAGKPWVLFTPALTANSRGGLADPAAELSPLDCFHPSAAGQSSLGLTAWNGAAGAPGIEPFFGLEPAVARAPRIEPAHAPVPSPELRAQLDAWRDAAARP